MNLESIGDELVAVQTTHSTPMILYGMERTVSPAVHVAHDINLLILSSNCQTQPLMTLRPGSVSVMVSPMRILQLN